MQRLRFRHSHQRSNDAGFKNLCSTEHLLPLFPIGHTAEVPCIYIFPSEPDSLVTEHRTISSPAPLFLVIPWLRIYSTRQVGCGEAEREYYYIVVGVYMRVIAPVHYSVYQLTHTRVLSSLRAYLSAPQGLSIQARIKYVPAPSQSLFAFPIRAAMSRTSGRTSSIPISWEASGACACHPVGEHPGVASHDTAFHLPPAEQPSVILHKFAGARASVALPASSFYVFMHDIDSGIGCFSDNE